MDEQARADAMADAETSGYLVVWIADERGEQANPLDGQVFATARQADEAARSAARAARLVGSYWEIKTTAARAAFRAVPGLRR